MKVIIVGAGIGGLALAQGLLRRDIEVVVLERDTDLRATGGYSLHLRANALAGLRQLLDPSAVEHLYAIAHGGWNQQGFAVRDHKARLLGLGEPSQIQDTLDIDRITLRLLLADGLGSALRTGVEVVGHVHHQDGSASAVLAGGERVTGDVVIAADGVGSAITTALAGSPTASPTTLIGVAGRTLAAAVSEEARELFEQRSSLAVGPGGTGLYVGYHGALDQAAVRSFSYEPLNEDPVYIWGAIFLDWAQTALLRRQSGAALVTAVRDQLRERHWRDDLLDLIAAADPGSLSSFRFHASARYPAGIAPWAAGPVTGIGDSVHAMPPTGGLGASTAIRDAHAVHDQLLAADAGEKTVAIAVHDYHLAMRGYAAEAVNESMQPASWIRASARPIGSAIARAGLPAAAAVSWAVRATRQKLDA